MFLYKCVCLYNISFLIDVCIVHSTYITSDKSHIIKDSRYIYFIIKDNTKTIIWITNT